MKKNYYKDLQENTRMNLVRAFEALGLTQRSIARLTETTEATISRCLSGQRSITLRLLANIVDKLNIFYQGPRRVGYEPQLTLGDFLDEEDLDITKERER